MRGVWYIRGSEKTTEDASAAFLNGLEEHASQEASVVRGEGVDALGGETGEQGD